MKMYQLDWIILLGRRPYARKDMSPNFGHLEKRRRSRPDHRTISGYHGVPGENSGRRPHRGQLHHHECWSSIARGFTAAFIAKGLSIEVAMGIEREHVLKAMGAPPKESVHCALLATNTLKAALKDFSDASKGD